MPNVKNAILKKKIEGVIYDLNVKTTAAQVYLDDAKTLDKEFTTLAGTVAANAAKLAELVGEGGEGSIAEQIQTAVDGLKQAIEDQETPGAIGYRLKAVEDAVAAINHESTGILVTAKSYTDQQIAAHLGSAYRAAGSIDFASLPALGATEEGKVYNVSDAFVTTENFVEGAGKSMPAGTNVVCIDVGEDEYKWDVLSGMVDLSAYETAAITAGKIDAAKQEAIQTAAQDATSKADGAKTAAIEAANQALTAYKGEVTAALAGKGRFIVSDTEPADLTEYDLWAYVAPDAEP